MNNELNRAQHNLLAAQEELRQMGEANGFEATLKLCMETCGSYEQDICCSESAVIERHGASYNQWMRARMQIDEALQSIGRIE